MTSQGTTAPPTSTSLFAAREEIALRLFEGWYEGPENKIIMVIFLKDPNFYYDANPDLDTDPDPDCHKNYADPQKMVTKL